MKRRSVLSMIPLALGAAKAVPAPAEPELRRVVPQPVPIPDSDGNIISARLYTQTIREDRMLDYESAGWVSMWMNGIALEPEVDYTLQGRKVVFLCPKPLGFLGDRVWATYYKAA